MLGHSWALKKLKIKPKNTPRRMAGCVYALFHMPELVSQFLDFLPDFVLSNAGSIVVHGQAAAVADADAGHAWQRI